MSAQESHFPEPRPFIVAIDGPAASGKGTLARRVAQRFGFAHLDTGKLYRATALLVLRSGGDPTDLETAARAARNISVALLSDAELRTERVGDAASIVAAMPPVRAALLDYQRRFATNPPPPPMDPRGTVLDGRDIGNTVCPEAQVKLFVTASPETRAARRLKQLRETGATAIYADVLQDMKERDARDSSRRVAPLKPAPDAVTIDTTALGPDQVFELASNLIARALAAPTG